MRWREEREARGYKGVRKSGGEKKERRGGERVRGRGGKQARGWGREEVRQGARELGEEEEEKRRH
eukprot:2023304-Pleurochrysis_carterae.AAC.1